MSRRTEKIARSLQVNLAELVNYHLSDPRIDRMITINSVHVSEDLAHARVMFTALNANEIQLRTLLRALEHAAGKLRGLLNERMEMRMIPELTFRVDEQAIRTRETLEAIARAMAQTRPLPPAEEPPGSPAAEVPGGAGEEPHEQEE